MVVSWLNFFVLACLTRSSAKISVIISTVEYISQFWVLFAKRGHLHKINEKLTLFHKNKPFFNVTTTKHQCCIKINKACAFHQEINQYIINTKSKHFHFVIRESTYFMKAWAFVDADVSLILEFVTFTTTITSLQLMKA